MKFVLLFGPQAVGKMTVGQALEKRTGLKLFHNHMTIEMLQPYFGFKPEMWRLSTMFRTEIFKAFSATDQPGMIFTYVWAFDLQEDWDHVAQITEPFEKQGATIYFVELEADLDERLTRNESPHRLAHKPTKRDVDASANELKETFKNHRLNSKEGEIQREHYLRINNTHLDASEVAKRIAAYIK